jgi:TldD protein
MHLSQSVPDLYDEAPGTGGLHVDRFSQQARQQLAAGLGSPALLTPIIGEGAERELADAAIATLKELGVQFGDLRLGRDIWRNLSVNDDSIASHRINESVGMGIRALVRGFWGFAATPDLTPQGVAAAAARAVAMAKAVAQSAPATAATTPAHWAAEPAHQATFHTPVGICPFATSVEDLARPLREAGAIGRAHPAVKRVNAFLVAFGRRRIFASTDGAYIVSTHCVVDSQQRFHAVDKGTSAYRTLLTSALAGGLEHYYAYDYPGAAPEAIREAVLKCSAAKPADGRYSLILDGHNLALTMHESVGHPTELDRVLGYELGFAGGSFASLDKLGKFQYASPIVNFTANNRIRYGGASQGYDDEGVECRSFPVIREGVLVGYGTSRETAHKIGEARANGTCRSTSWFDAPIVRIPNLYLEPGKDKLSLDELIADTKDGIYMMGRDSFSIDQMRYNFQFGADMCYRVKNGKLAEPLRDVIYQSISPEFWGSCDAICDADAWQMHGVFNCGKGQPMQIARMMHGASPARFRDIRVGY